MSTSAAPAGYHTVTPYLIVRDAAKAVEFYKQALGATEYMRLNMPDGKVGHAELRIGDSPIMLADEFPEMGAKSPASYGGSPISILLYVADVDAAAARATAAGMTVKRPVADQFYGDRSGVFEDPFGHNWSIATRKETLSNAEIQRRAAESMQKQPK